MLVSGAAAKLPDSLVKETIRQVLETARPAVQRLEGNLPKDFPMEIHKSVSAAVTARLKDLSIL